MIIDEQPKPISPRAQAQLNAALAIQDLARSRGSTSRGIRESSSDRRPISSPSNAKPGFTTGPRISRVQASGTRDGSSRYGQTSTTSDSTGSSQTPVRSLSRSGLSRGPIGGSSRPPSSREPRPARSNTGRERPPARRGPRNDDEFDEDGDRISKQKDDVKKDDELTLKETTTIMKKMGWEQPFQIKPAQGPHLDMASMMMEFAPKHFGATEPTSGQYPSLTDNNRRGLLQDIIKQVRKNETYTEKNIDQMAKRLGPAMPRA